MKCICGSTCPELDKLSRGRMSQGLVPGCSRQSSHLAAQQSRRCHHIRQSGLGFRPGTGFQAAIRVHPQPRGQDARGGLVQRPHLIAPAEALFEPLVNQQAHTIAGMPRGALVDGAAFVFPRRPSLRIGPPSLWPLPAEPSCSPGWFPHPPPARCGSPTARGPDRPGGTCRPPPSC